MWLDKLRHCQWQLATGADRVALQICATGVPPMLILAGAVCSFHQLASSRWHRSSTVVILNLSVVLKFALPRQTMPL